MTDPTLPAMPEPIGHIHSDGEFCWDRNPPQPVFWPLSLVTLDAARSYAEACVAKERERCARICVAKARELRIEARPSFVVADQIAAAIRKKGKA